MMKKLSKRFFHHPLTQVVLCWSAAQYIRLVYHLSRVEKRFSAGATPYMNGERQVIFAFWHGRLLMMPHLSPPNRKMHVMISQHLDGELIARTMTHFGFDLVRGSSRKGALSAALSGARILRAGDNLAITPDGPKGPNRQVQPGILFLSKLIGVPIVPITFSSSRCKRMNSWDRFMVAFPFGRLTLLAGEPLRVPDDADDAMLESLRHTLQDRMNRLSDDADRLVNYSPSSTPNA